MTALHVLVNQIDAFNDNLLTVIQHLLDRLRNIRSVIACDNNDHVTTFDFHFKLTKFANREVYR